MEQGSEALGGFVVSRCDRSDLFDFPDGAIDRYSGRFTGEAATGSK